MTQQWRAKLVRTAIGGAVLAGCAVAVAAPAVADTCDPLLMSMTPQPVLACQPPQDVPPPPDQPVAAPVPPQAEPVPPPAEPGPFGLEPAPSP